MHSYNNGTSLDSKMLNWSLLTNVRRFCICWSNVFALLDSVSLEVSFSKITKKIFKVFSSM